MDSGDDKMRPQVYEVTQPLCDTPIHPFNLKRFGLHPTGGLALWWARGGQAWLSPLLVGRTQSPPEPPCHYLAL